MIPEGFEYVAPTSLDEALRLLDERADDAKLLAGGHSLLPVMKLRLASPGLLIDLRRVPGLKGVRRTADGLSVGPMTTYTEIINSADAAAVAPALVAAARAVGDRQVRARGTIGGSLSHADPASDMPAVALALGATVVLRSTAGERTVPAEEFFTNMMETAARPNEIMTEIRVPASPRSVYEKHPNPASHYAIVGVAAVARDGGVRVGITGAAAVPYRATAAEQQLSGGLNGDAIGRAAAAAGNGQDFLGDLHASSEYRGHLVEVYTKRALNHLTQV
jgi:aerobic carbon-monoxide dehydrogenase medium subunit